MNPIDVAARLRSSSLGLKFKEAPADSALVQEIVLELPLASYREFFKQCRAEAFFPHPRMVFFCLGPGRQLMIRIDEAYSGAGLLIGVPIQSGAEPPSIADLWPAVKWHEREVLHALRAASATHATDHAVVVGAVVGEKV